MECRCESAHLDRDDPRLGERPARYWVARRPTSMMRASRERGYWIDLPAGTTLYLDGAGDPSEGCPDLDMAFGDRFVVTNGDAAGTCVEGLWWVAGLSIDVEDLEQRMGPRPTPAPAPPPAEVARRKIFKLGEMRRQRIITPQEFEILKAEILARV